MRHAPVALTDRPTDCTVDRAADGPTNIADGYDTDDDDGGKLCLDWTPEPVDHLLGTV